jgi:hypothetical protein
MARVRGSGRVPGSMVYCGAMELPADAARALEVVRRTGQDVRFEIRKACEQERWRLKVCWRSPDNGGESQLGLLWSEDQAGLESLRDRLERGTA